MTLLQPKLEDLTNNDLSDRAMIVGALTEFRREWQKIADGESLIVVQSSVGLLLSDLTDRLNLTPPERYAMLGGRLSKEVNNFKEQSVRLKSTS